MDTKTPPQIGPLLAQHRRAHKLTLEQLSTQSGVSKSMLSQIERGEANPSFAVLWSLTTALNIKLSELVEGAAAQRQDDQIEVVAESQLPKIVSTDAHCTLKILSPPRLAGSTEWYEMEIEPGGALDSAAHAQGTMEHVTAWTDGLEISSGDATITLKSGETARYLADRPHCIRNLGREKARGLMVMLYKP
ncbi:helix-turn-helix domain-containing protein [Limoniibacter endophyticus]|nr:XRE family transcriptional regulator [Limoniibacter endophyticus]